MRAAVLHEFHQPLEVEEIQIETPQPGELVVRMAASGVCRSDLHVQEERSPVARFVPPLKVKSCSPALQATISLASNKTALYHGIQRIGCPVISNRKIRGGVTGSIASFLTRSSAILARSPWFCKSSSHR